MDRLVRAQLIELLSTVEEGIRYIQTSGQTAMFAECAAGIAAIAKACQDGLSARQYSSRYAKLFDRLIHAMQPSSEVVLSPEWLDETCKLLQMAATELQQEGKAKKEILFLPYKASMWDSLESIWLAAREDEEHCDVYVVPIPYCDRNPDGTAAKWHYEANLLPDYVPVTDYREYDVAERRPDAIYIHNPFDGCNLVTSVDSRYYSQELKKHTDMLVYVPYFILGKEWPESHVQLPCYQYMDKMVVPQENMQIRMTQGQLLDACLHDYIPAKKLVPLGSPKADRVFFCEKNKKIPNAWEKVIRGKKVILYNTSLSSVLRFGEQALQKMKLIFASFARHKEIELLWRPHPLMTATLKSMRPELYAKYKALEKEFVTKRLGVLDETPDINMAVAIADAYLGESTSSVVHLFGIAGKPVFFTNEMMLWDTPTPDEAASVRFGHTLAENGEVWFIAEGYNALCRMNLVSGQITPVAKFDDFPVLAGLYSRFLKMDNIILFSPGNAKEICEYSLETGECKKIPLENPLEYGNFGHIVRYKQYVFLLPWRYPAILRMCLMTGECRYYTECLQELLACRTQENDGLLGDYRIRGQKLLLPAVQTNKLLEFDMETGKYQFHTVGQEQAGYAFMIENGDEYWLIPRKTRAIVKWNSQTGDWKTYAIYPEDFTCDADWNSGDTYMFSSAVKMNGAIWLFPCYANKVIRLDLSTETLEQVDLALPYGIGERKSAFYKQQPNFFNAFAGGDNIIMALSAYDRSLVVVDTVTKTCRLQPCRLAEADVQALSTPIEQSFGCISAAAPYMTAENGLWRNVESFIEYVVAGRHDKQAQQEAYAGFINNADGSCGKKVHQYIMGQVCDAGD
ncbi:hypothetical protein [Sporomusa sp. GT1]|uniref:hypothetical protein n=1 Tax=Sporomusa sp. GT1 TaxID=1534747 RepID=UPI00166C6823|nr:hypothetical protein [Sporomusa sp. GT1]